MSTDTRDLAGYIFRGQSHVHAAPSGCRFILRPTEHAAIYGKPLSGKRVEATTNVTVNSLVPSKKHEMVTKESVSLKSKFDKTSVTVKYNRKLKLLHVGQMLDSKMTLHSECKDKLYVWSKKVLFQDSTYWCYKLVSDNTSIEFYESVMDGIREYHVRVFSIVEINNCKVVPLLKVQYNKNNISEVHFFQKLH